MAGLKPFQKKRLPIYFTGFAIGLAAMMTMIQVKKATAPEFPELADARNPAEMASGGQVRLRLGEEPGHYLAWGFPTQLTVTKKNEAGVDEPVIHMEYRDLVEPETLVGPLSAPGVYDLQADFYACDRPGEKYCTRVNLTQTITVKPDRDLLHEIGISVDVKGVAERAAQMGINRNSPEGNDRQATVRAVEKADPSAASSSH